VVFIFLAFVFTPAVLFNTLFHLVFRPVSNWQ
jgi:hypothetical protein